MPQGSAGGYGQGQGGFGGQGGYGQGGMGAGTGGNAFGRAEDKKAKPDDDDQSFWQTKTAVLTPGDRVEFKLKMKKGETLFASASSDAFDPALSVEDSKGKVLAKNDDREEGDQSPFVICRFLQDGEYVLKVLSFRSVSGGKFAVKMRTFLSMDAPLGATEHELAKPQQNLPNRAIFRLVAKKGNIYDLRFLKGVKPNTPYGGYMVRVVGPSGVPGNDMEPIPTADSSPVFIALADGDYYAEYQTDSATVVNTDYRIVTKITTKATAEESFDLEAGEIKIVEFPVQPNQIIRTSLSTSQTSGLFSAPRPENQRNENRPRQDNSEQTLGSYDAHGNFDAWSWYLLNRDLQTDIVRVFHGTGVGRAAIRSIKATREKITLKNSESLPEWKSGEPIQGTMEIGESRLMILKSSKSELMRVAVTAQHFQPKLEIFKLSGETANTLMDRRTHTAGDDLYFPDADTFIIRLTCDGFGGSGDFTMKREVLTATPYTLGATQTLTLDGSNFGLYSVNLEAGKRYQLTADELEKGIRADLLDEDGQFLRSQRIRFDQVEVQYFVPTRSGRHRLWLRGGPGERHFRFELHAPPSLSGGG